MKTKRQAGFTLFDLLLAVGAAAASVTLIVVLVTSTREKGESHRITTDSYRVAGMALCQKLHGNDSSALVKCVMEVETEWSRAVATKSAFNKAAVPSIPANQWP